MSKPPCLKRKPMGESHTYIHTYIHTRTYIITYIQEHTWLHIYVHVYVYIEQFNNVGTYVYSECTAHKFTLNNRGWEFSNPHQKNGSINLLRGINIKGRKRQAYVAKGMPACHVSPSLFWSWATSCGRLALRHEFLQTTTAPTRHVCCHLIRRRLSPARHVISSPRLPVATCDLFELATSARQGMPSPPTLSWYVFLSLFRCSNWFEEEKEERPYLHATSCPCMHMVFISLLDVQIEWKKKRRTSVSLCHVMPIHTVFIFFKLSGT